MSTRNTNSVSQFANWAPIRTYWQGDRLMVDWCYLGEARFTDPFFGETIERALYRPFNLLFRRQTPVEWLCDLETLDPGLPPAGFIFHMSRCGSTLAAQMLAALPENLVLSEPAPIDGILTTSVRNPAVTDDQRMHWLRAMVSALSRRRHPGEKRVFIKFDSWHAVDLPLIRSAFPSVPWIFLYRDPVEVMVSHQNMPGAQMVPGLISFSLDMTTEAAMPMPREEYRARVLAKICGAALEHASCGGRFVNYRDLLEGFGPVLTEHFGVGFTPEEIDRMRETAKFDAKAPFEQFSPDNAKKKVAATPAIRTACETWLGPVYDRLEEVRWRPQPLSGVPGASPILETAAG